MKIRALIIGLIAAAVILTAREARGYRLFDFKADPPIITYDHPMIGEAVRIWAQHGAVIDGGLVPSERALITGRVPFPWEWGYQVAGVAIPVAPGGVLAYCEVQVNPAAWNWLAVWVHEVGHCLGLAHSEKDDAMMSAWCCNPISDDDVAAIQALYGPARPKIYIPLTARD